MGRKAGEGGARPAKKGWMLEQWAPGEFFRGLGPLTPLAAARVVRPPADRETVCCRTRVLPPGAAAVTTQWSSLWVLRGSPQALPPGRSGKPVATEPALPNCAQPMGGWLEEGTAAARAAAAARTWSDADELPGRWSSAASSRWSLQVMLPKPSSRTESKSQVRELAALHQGSGASPSACAAGR